MDKDCLKIKLTPGMVSMEWFLYDGDFRQERVTEAKDKPSVLVEIL